MARLMPRLRIEWVVNNASDAQRAYRQYERAVEKKADPSVAMLQLLHSVHSTREQSRIALTQLVHQARLIGLTWYEIGDALDMTAQGAQALLKRNRRWVT